MFEIDILKKVDGSLEGNSAFYQNGKKMPIGWKDNFFEYRSPLVEDADGDPVTIKFVGVPKVDWLVPQTLTSKFKLLFFRTLIRESFKGSFTVSIHDGKIFTQPVNTMVTLKVNYLEEKDLSSYNQEELLMLQANGMITYNETTGESSWTTSTRDGTSGTLSPGSSTTNLTKEQVTTSATGESISGNLDILNSTGDKTFKDLNMDGTVDGRTENAESTSDTLNKDGIIRSGTIDVSSGSTSSGTLDGSITKTQGSSTESGTYEGKMGSTSLSEETNLDSS